MDMPRVTDAHRKLEVFAGTWAGDETVHPSPFDPQGGPAKARVENRVALGGFAIVQDYAQERGGKTSFRGHCIFRFDAQANGYELYWFDSFGMKPTVFAGSESGNVWTFTAHDPQTGSMRCTFDFAKAGKYRFLMEVSPDGKQWFPFLEGNYGKA